MLYVAPERFATPGFVDRLRPAEIGLFVVDEAHCVSQWGHDFRPEYFRLGEVARALGARSLFAATATATPRVAGDVVRRLGLRDPVRITTGFDRPNLSYDVVGVALGAGQARGDAAAALRARGAAGDRLRRDAQEDRGDRRPAAPRARPTGARLPRRDGARGPGGGAARVHVRGGAGGRGHERVRDGRRQGRRPHRHPRDGARRRSRPTTRRPGAAGRDGLASRCVLLAENRDKGLHVFFINQIDDPEAKRHRWRQYREVWGFVEGEALPARGDPEALRRSDAARGVG